MDGSLPGSSVNGLLQVRILKWVAVPFSRGTSQLRDRTASLTSMHWQVSSFPLAPPALFWKLKKTHQSYKYRNNYLHFAIYSYFILGSRVIYDQLVEPCLRSLLNIWYKERLNTVMCKCENF